MLRSVTIGDPGDVHIDDDRMSARQDATDAAAAADIHIRELHDAAGCRALVDVLNRIWSSGDEDLIAIGELVALGHAGNYVTLAERNGTPVGGGIGFFGPPGQPFHSHIVGVAPTTAGRGVGRAIKLHQRAWCRDRGVDVMTWTYDPLVARNAYFNVRVLGALPVEYYHDFDGPMDDGINRGQFTDRMLIRWGLSDPDPRPDAAANGSEHEAVANDDDTPGTWAPPPGRDAPVLVGVPRDIEAIRRNDPELARAWRHETRSAF